MKRIVFLYSLLAILGVAPLHAGTTKPYQSKVIESSDRYLVVDVQFDSVGTIQRKSTAGWVTEFSLPGSGYSDEENRPKLPVSSLLLGIPAQGTPRLTIQSEETIQKNVGLVATVEWPEWDARRGDGVSLPALPAMYPLAAAQLGTDGFLRDQRVLQIDLFPVRYLSAQQTAQITRQMRLRIDFTPASSISAAISQSANLSTDQGFEPVLAASLDNYEGSSRWRVMPARSTTLQKTVSTTVERYRLTVEHDGLYMITGADLKSAGADLGAIQVATLNISHRGQEIPILVEGTADGRLDEQDRIIFIGRHAEGDVSYFSIYTDYNVYWLSWGETAGVRFVPVNGALGGSLPDTVRSAAMQLHLEKESSEYERFMSITDDEVDPWYWRDLRDRDSFQLALPIDNARSDQPLAIRVGMRGSTWPPQSPDHHVNFFLNDEAIGSQLWDGQTQTVFDTRSRLFNLRSENNQLRMETPLDLPDVTVERVLLDWIEVDFTGWLKAQNDSLRFSLTAPERVIVRADGFASGKIYILTEEGLVVTQPTLMAGKGGTSCLFGFQSSANSQFYLVGERNLGRVKSLEKDIPSNLKDPGNAADYIIITHRLFWDQAQQLASRRSHEGYRTAVVDIQDVYDEFNGGIFDPRAIRDFLKYAYHNWTKPSPLYVLLFGDTTHHMDKRYAHEIGQLSYVPAIMVYTSGWAVTSSDNAAVCVNGDDTLPDMYVGRFPVGSVEEAKNLVQKTLDYELKPVVGDWRRNLALVTDASEPERQAQDLYDNYTPERYVTNRLTTIETSPHFGSTEDLANLINRGQTLLNFIGHGGGGVYFYNELFLPDDIVRLNNKDRYAVIFSMTCHVGHFDDDENSSLSEDLLRAQDKGIVAHFGSAGRATLLGDYYLDRSLFQVIFGSGSRRMGEIITLGKILLISTTSGNWDAVKSFVLLGDPALNFYIAPPTVQLQVPKTDFATGDTVRVTGQCGTVKSGTVLVSLYNASDSLIVQKEAPLVNGQFATDLFALTTENVVAWPEGEGKAIIRAYANNGSVDGCSSQAITINNHGSARLYLDPAAPRHLQNVNFICQFNESQFTDRGGVQAVYLQWSLNRNSWTRIYFSRQSDGVWHSNTSLCNSEGTRIYYQLFILGNDGREYADTVQYYTVGYRADLLIKPTTVHIQGTPGAQIVFTVSNIGETPSGRFNIQIAEGLSATTYKPVATEIWVENLPAKKDTTLVADWNGTAGGDRKLWFNIDVGNQVEESNEGNNTTLYQAKIVTPADGTNGPLYATEGNYYIDVPVGAVSQSTTFSLISEWQDTQNQAAQYSGLTPLSLRYALKPFAYRVDYTDSAASMKKNISVAALYEKSDSQILEYVDRQSLRLYGWNETSHTWKALPCTVDKIQGIISAAMPPDCRTFALMACEDQQPPEIRFSVAGQNFAEGDMVPAKPVFSALMTDGSGFDVAGGDLTLYLDQQKVEAGQYQLFQSADSRRTLTLTFTPTLTAGSHRLEVQVKDINGNLGSAAITFQVSGVLGILSLANHPNPFVSVTTIAFTLTEMASRVDLNIYTVSGRLVRTFTLYDVAGYQEVDWDGTDQDGMDLANGVYYLRFTARNGEKKIERIEKMARLQ